MKLYSIPYPVSYFVIVTYFSINFIYNAVICQALLEACHVY